MSKKNLILKKIQSLRKKKFTAKDRLLVAVLSIGAVLIVFFVLYLIIYALSQRNIAHFLPAEETVVYIEFENFDLQPKLQSSSKLATTMMQDGIKKLLNTEDGADVTSWTNGKFGFALIETSSANSPVYFVQTSSRGKALKFFESLGVQDEEILKSNKTGTAIYSYSQSQLFHFTFVGPHVFISTNKNLLQKIQDVYAGKLPTLSEDENYQKSFSNLPRSSWMKGYINFQALKFDKIEVNNVIEPLKNVINHFAITVRQNPNGFHFNVFANLNKDVLSLQEGYGGNTRFAYDLTNYISSKNLALYIGGANLSQEWQNTLSTISNLNPAYGIILESIINAQVTNVFGRDVSLRNDVYPLFEGEYALAIGNTEDNLKDVRLILSSSDQSFSEIKLAKMMIGFKYIAAKFAPKIHKVTLPDGTESIELIPDNSKLEEGKETYEGYEVHCIDVQNSSTGFCYTVTDDLIVMTNNKKGVLNTIDMTLLPQFTLSQHQPFRQTISNLSKVSDEITFIDIQKSIPFIENNQYGLLAKPFLNKFDAASWVKHYFDDGVSAEGYILIK